jgi:hypothetical protein
MHRDRDSSQSAGQATIRLDGDCLTDVIAMVQRDGHEFIRHNKGH